MFWVWGKQQKRGKSTSKMDSVLKHLQAEMGRSEAREAFWVVGQQQKWGCCVEEMDLWAEERKGRDWWSRVWSCFMKSGEFCGRSWLQRRVYWFLERIDVRVAKDKGMALWRRREGRREKGSLGADKKIRFQTLGFLCRKSWLADEKRREGRRDRVHGWDKVKTRFLFGSRIPYRG